MKTNILSVFFLVSAHAMAGCLANSSAHDELAMDNTSTVDDSTDDSTNKSKAYGPNSVVIDPAELPFGAPYEEWAAAYWQWIMSIPVEKNPMLGGPCEQGQSGSVFFLPGSLGGGDTHTCTISSGQGIFLPVLSATASLCPEMADTPKVCADFTSETNIRNAAQKTIDGADALLHVTVDDVDVKVVDQYRVQSTAFKNTSPDDPADRLFSTCSGPIEANLCEIVTGDARMAVADGYFVMLRPLAAGLHVIHVAANVAPNSPLPPTDLTYNIVVLPTPATAAE